MEKRLEIEEKILPKYARAMDMESWLRDPRIAARGFAHRWKSAVAGGNGEDAFLILVDQHLHPEHDVLDLGCGHGEYTLSLAPRCRTITGIERDADYLALARELGAERNASNVRFLQANLAGPDEDDRAFVGIPLPDDSIDLFINRRGPILRRYLAEAIRVGRPGAAIVALHPAGNMPAPPWLSQLPDPFQTVFTALPFDEVTAWVTGPLHAASIADYSLWWMDVPEVLRNPQELYVRLGGERLPNATAYQDVEPQLARIFEQHGTSHGVILRHQRLLWRAQLPE